MTEEEESPPSKKAWAKIKDYVLEVEDSWYEERKQMVESIEPLHTKTKDKYSCLFLVSCLL